MVSPQARREQIHFAARTWSVATTCLWAAGTFLARPWATGCANRGRMRRRWPRCAPRRRSIRATAIGAFASFCGGRVCAMGINRARRLWRQAGLACRRKRPRRRIATSRPDRCHREHANHVWAYDFVFDSCANGQQLKCLTVVDEFTHECLAIDVAGSIRSGARHRRTDATDERARCAGLPAFGQRTGVREPRNPALAHRRAYRNRASSIPASHGRTAPTNRFNGKFRDECLSVEWFRTRREAQVIIEAWRRHYNAVRPHSSLAS